MILIGDCLEQMRELADNSVDAVVCDPPYGLKFMNRKWDYDVPSVDVWREVLRVLKPGGHALIACGTRTQHRMTVNIEDAGFEIRDVVTWLYGSGFPKSLDISKAIDKAAGAEREVVGKRTDGRYAYEFSDAAKQAQGSVAHNYSAGWVGDPSAITAPATPLAKQWQGWGTALKPSCEFWTLARKPLIGTVAENVEKYGTGGLNIDKCRIGLKESENAEKLATRSGKGSSGLYDGAFGQNGGWDCSRGRWPANTIIGCACETDTHEPECAVAMLDEMSGHIASGYRKNPSTQSGSQFHNNSGAGERGYMDSGGASRFYYIAKASKAERNAGLDKQTMVKVETGECKDANTVAVQLLQKVISESTVKWLIAECGERITATFPKECKSTIKTEISRTIESKILNSLILSLTSESIQDANLSTASGSSHAKSVAQLKEFLLTITKGVTELALGASRAAKKTLQSISESDELPALTNFHSTVKPIRLMQYLIKLITPPNGVVLDPFMGSGSTGCAAVSLGFNFIGIEREAEYAEIAQKRIEHYLAKEQSL